MISILFIKNNFNIFANRKSLFNFDVHPKIMLDLEPTCIYTIDILVEYFAHFTTLFFVKLTLLLLFCFPIYVNKYLLLVPGRLIASLSVQHD